MPAKHDHFMFSGKAGQMWMGVEFYNAQNPSIAPGEHVVFDMSGASSVSVTCEVDAVGGTTNARRFMGASFDAVASVDGTNSQGIAMRGYLKEVPVYDPVLAGNWLVPHGTFPGTFKSSNTGAQRVWYADGTNVAGQNQRIQAVILPWRVL